MFFFWCICLSVCTESWTKAWNLGRRNGLDVDGPESAHLKTMIGNILEPWGEKKEQGEQSENSYFIYLYSLGPLKYYR